MGLGGIVSEYGKCEGFDQNRVRWLVLK